MRRSLAAGGLALLLAMAGDAAAQTRDPAPVPSDAPQPSQNPAFDAAKLAADALGPDEVARIQRALIWTGDLNTMASGEFGRRSFDAIRAFQKRVKAKDTGILLPNQRVELDKGATRAIAAVGFKSIAEEGVTLGYPAKLATQRTGGRNGPKLASPTGTVTVDILRIPASAEAFDALFTRLKTERPGRKVTYSLMRPDFFVVTGTVDGMNFYMRFLRTDADSRGFIVGWAPQLSPGFDRVPIAMAVSLAVDDGGAVAAAEADVPVVSPPSGPPVPLPEGEARVARTGLGFAVSEKGDVLTSAGLVAGCRTVAVADGTTATVVAGDPAADIALVRLSRPAASVSAWRVAPVKAGEAVTVIASFDGKATPRATQVSAISGANGDMRRFTMDGGGAGAGVFDGDGAIAGLVAGNGQTGALKGLFVSAFLRSQGVTMPVGTGEDPSRSTLTLTCDPGKP